MKIGADWWKDFFSGLWLELQPRFKSQEQTIQEADFYEKALKIPNQAKILDIPCGNGRLSLELASRGYQVTGVDITERFIDSARRKASESQLSITFKTGDMRDLPWHEEFDTAFSAWGSFGYFDETGDRDFLEAVCRSLKTGGLFMMDIMVAESILPHFLKRTWSVWEDLTILQERQWNHETGRIDEEWTFIKGDIKEIKYSSVRIYTYREITEMMKNAGFNSCSGYSDMSMTPFSLGGGRLFILGAK